MADIRPQLPVRASDDSMPEPDFLVVPRRDTPGPRVRKGYLVIEIADSSLTFDRAVKAPLNAATRTPEYWIVDARKQQLEVFRKPMKGAYTWHQVLGPSDVIRPVAFPRLELSLASFLRPLKRADSRKAYSVATRPSCYDCGVSDSVPAAALELTHVTKQFERLKAVDDVSLRLEVGSFLGLVGRNGAGKSTTLKMATGLIPPTTGVVKVLGFDVALDPLSVKQRIGAMPEDMALLEMLTGPQYLRFVGRMYGLEDAVIDSRRDELFALLELAPQPRTLIADYSFGMKKKIALCAALLHGPKLVFLDEPFEGIDPVTRRVMKDLLLGLQKKGVTLVLTTHILEVVEALCPLIAIIDGGRLRGFGPLDSLRSEGQGLEDLFLELVGGSQKGELSWL